MMQVEDIRGVAVADDHPFLFSGDKSGVGGGSAYPEARKIQVLIIEDELLVALDLEETALRMGHDVCGIAATAEDAVQLAAETAPDLLLADVNLGAGADGIEAAQRIVSDRPSAVIFVTAYDSAEFRARARDAVPGSLVLGKPLSERQLREAIGRLFPPPN